MKKLSLNERAEAARRRLTGRGEAWDNALHGYLAGHLAAKREAAKQIKAMLAEIRDMRHRMATLREINMHEKANAVRFERALRERARGDVMETRHPFKELRP